MRCAVLDKPMSKYNGCFAHVASAILSFVFQIMTFNGLFKALNWAKFALLWLSLPRVKLCPQTFILGVFILLRLIPINN